MGGGAFKVRTPFYLKYPYRMTLDSLVAYRPASSSLTNTMEPLVAQAAPVMPSSQTQPVSSPKQESALPSFTQALPQPETPESPSKPSFTQPNEAQAAPELTHADQKPVTENPLVTTPPNDAEAAQQQGDAEKQQAYAQAISQFETALANNPNMDLKHLLTLLPLDGTPLQVSDRLNDPNFDPIAWMKANRYALAGMMNTEPMLYDAIAQIMQLLLASGAGENGLNDPKSYLYTFLNDSLGDLNDIQAAYANAALYGQESSSGNSYLEEQRDSGRVSNLKI